MVNEISWDLERKVPLIQQRNGIEIQQQRERFI
jgi:hypothetical protein